MSKFFDIPSAKIIAVPATENYRLAELVDLLTHEFLKDKKITFIRNMEKRTCVGKID